VDPRSTFIVGETCVFSGLKAKNPQPERLEVFASWGQTLTLLTQGRVYAIITCLTFDTRFQISSFFLIILRLWTYIFLNWPLNSVGSLRDTLRVSNIILSKRYESLKIKNPQPGGLGGFVSWGLTLTLLTHREPMQSSLALLMTLNFR
jgi:hypothetical protein